MAGSGIIDSNLCETEVIEIPASYKGYPVTEIGYGALQNIRTKKLIIRAPITKINDNGIRNFVFKELYLPPNLISLNKYSIFHMKSEIDIIFPTGTNLLNVTYASLGYAEQKCNIFYCGYNNVSYSSNPFHVSVSVEIFVPPGGPSTFLGRNTTEMNSSQMKKCINPYFLSPSPCTVYNVCYLWHTYYYNIPFLLT